MEKQPANDVSKKMKDVLVPVIKYSEALAENITVILREVLAESISKAGKNARLSGYDEKIYEAYVQLISFYRQTVAKYDEQRDLLASPRIKNIADGIDSLIKSRLSHFDENDYAKGNPAATERRQIVSDSLSQMQEACDGLQAQLSDPARRMEFLRCAEDGQTLLHFLPEELLRELIVKYTENIRLCLNKLDEVETYKVTYYKELLDEEMEILSSIIKIQLAPLETEKACSPSEEIVVEQFSSGLKEAYQHFGKSVDEISTYFMSHCEKKHEPEILSAEQITECIYGAAARDKTLLALYYNFWKSGLQTAVAELKETLLSEIVNFTEKNKKMSRVAYEQQVGMAIYVFMSEEMVDVFKNVLKFSDNSIAQAKPDKSLEILKGISETMAIKIDNITESREEFLNNCYEILDGFKANKPVLAAGEPERITEEAFGKMLMMEPDADATANFKQILEDCLAEDYQPQVEKHIAQFSSKIEKEIANFRRDCLLFEVVTFEEIINYSVSRLQESDDEEILSFADCAYEGSIMLDIILKKNNIIPIKPAAHELFNGREHEVIMAEKNENYKKGEIIKLVNAGYKQDDLVMIRANVIAAK